MFKIRQIVKIHHQIFSRSSIFELQTLSKRLIASKSPPKAFNRIYWLAGGTTFVVTWFALSLAELINPKEKQDELGHSIVWDSYRREVKSTEANPARVSVIDKIPKSELTDVKISRKFNGKRELNGLKLALFQKTDGPFSSVVRAFLDYYGIAYGIVDVSSSVEISSALKSTQKFPLILIDDARNKNEYLVLNDSTTIISILGTYLLMNKQNESIESIASNYHAMIDLETNESQVINKYFLLFDDLYKDLDSRRLETSLNEERHWRIWSDQSLLNVLLPNISPNITKPSESRHHKDDEIRQSLFQQANSWLRAIGSKGLFLGGEKPNLADLSVFGLFNSIEDSPLFHDLLENVKIGPWYYSMKELCTQNAGSEIDSLRDYLN